MCGEVRGLSWRGQGFLCYFLEDHINVSTGSVTRGRVSGICVFKIPVIVATFKVSEFRLLSVTCAKFKFWLDRGRTVFLV